MSYLSGRKRKSRFDDKPVNVAASEQRNVERKIEGLDNVPPTKPGGDDPSSKAGRALAIARKLGQLCVKRTNGDADDNGKTYNFREKVTVPDFIVSDPEINFIGLMLGPKGRTQKQMELETGAKITIRGRGSSKDGQAVDEDEDLYVQIVADSAEKTQKATALVNEIIYNKGKRDMLKQEQMKAVAEENPDNGSHGDINTNWQGQGTNNNYSLLLGPHNGGYHHQQQQQHQQKSFDHHGLGFHHQGGVNTSSLSETISIPADKVGIVIGRHGDTIKVIQAKTGAHLQVEREHNPEHPNTREVFIQGSSEQIELAKQEINQYIAGEASWKGRIMEGNDHIMVPNSIVGLVIGKAGETIKQLQQNTGCTIQVTPDSLSQGAKERKINLSGSPEQCAAAKEEIQKLVIKSVEKDRKGGRMSSGGMIGDDEDVMVIPSQCAGVLIGRGGDNVKLLANKTRTRIQVQRESVGEYREVKIKGDRQNIEYAKQEVQKVIEQYFVNQGWDPSAAYGNVGMWSQATAYDPTQATTGLVAGYNGSSHATTGVGSTTGAGTHLDPSTYSQYALQYAMADTSMLQQYASMGMMPQHSQPPPPSTPPEPQQPPPPNQPQPPQPSHRY